MTSPLALSQNGNLTVTRIGREEQPLVAVTDALADPAQVVEIAARHSYKPIGAFYPGLRAAVSERIAMPLVDPLLDQLTSAFDLARTPRFRECFLSVVTASPSDLAPIQRLPHFDGTGPERLAVLLYLDAQETGGTGFYRQRATGFESVDESRFETYRETLESEIARHGLPDSRYIDGDTEIFEQTHRIKGAFNSLVIYRGNTLHCAALPGDFAPETDPRKGRLTLNLFLD